MEKLKIPKTAHLVEWDREKIKDFWNFRACIPAQKKMYAGETASDAIIKLAEKSMPKKVCQILDIGFGSGALLEKMAKKGYICCGIDSSKETVSTAKKFFSEKKLNIDVKQGDITRIPFKDEKFDAVFASEVIEHLLDEDIELGLAKIKRCLKISGFLVLTTRYNESLEERIIMCPDCHAVFHRTQHLQTFNEKRMSDLLGKNGYKVITCQAVHFEPIQRIKRIIIRAYRLITNTQPEKKVLFAVAQK